MIQPHHYTEQEIGLIFGLNQSLNDYRSQVEKAQWWLHLRADLEEDKVKLASFTPAKLHHSSKKKLFEKNVPRVINSHQPGARTLLNIFNASHQTLLEESARLNLFMFACFSLSDNDFAKIEQYGLAEIFHQMLTAVVVDISLQPALTTKFKAIIKSFCRDDPISRMLLGWIAFFSFVSIFLYTSLSHFTNLPVKYRSDEPETQKN
jgi:hypothetical protein